MERSKVEKRSDIFAEKTSTAICKEIPSVNPYIPERVLWHGYDVLELTAKCDHIDVIYLLLKGDLPDEKIKRCLQKIMIALANPGPRHNATRAGMCASISKTETVHLLPISLETMSGDYLGAREVQNSMRFITEHVTEDPAVTARIRLDGMEEGDDRVAPGFGCIYGSPEIIPGQIAKQIIGSLPSPKALIWCDSFVSEITSKNYGWLTPGLAAAAFIDLGFNPREGGGLFQLCCAPGLLAHALEMSTQPVTNMPWIGDDRYIIENPS